MGAVSKAGIAIACLCASSLVLSACSHAGHVGDIATDYNRAIAQARSEQILLNVVRASGREPLQFTAFGEIAATVNRTVGIDTVATNLITGGADAITPTLRLGGSTVPIVRISPLASKEFIDGLLRPITPEVLHLFLSQGWDAEFLLPLVVASYQCPEGVQLNSGEARGNAVRDRLANAGSQFQLRRETREGAEVSLTVSNARALETLRAGVPEGHRILGITPGRRGTSVVRIRQPSTNRWIANPQSLCPNPRLQEAELRAGGDGAIQLRSAESILYFLGEAFRPCYLARRDGCALTYRKGDETRYLFRLRTGAAPENASAVAVAMYGTRYWIPRLDAEDTDRTLKTISFLNQLIAIQTNATGFNATPTLITLPSG